MLRWRLWHSTEYRHGARLHPRRDSGKQTLIKTWPALAVAVTRSPTLPFTCSPGPCVPAVRGLNPLHRHERADSQEGRPGPHPNTEVLMRACGSFTRLHLPDTMLSNDAYADLCMVASGRHRGNDPPHVIPTPIHPLMVFPQVHQRGGAAQDAPYHGAALPGLHLGTEPRRPGIQLYDAQLVQVSDTHAYTAAEPTCCEMMRPFLS